MISLCLIHSNNRHDQINQVIDYLLSLSLQSFEYLIISDGQTDFSHPQFKVIMVSRTSSHFCRADLWQAAVMQAHGEIVMIMDNDRLPHPNFFASAETLSSQSVLCCQRLYQLLEPMFTCDIIKMFDHGPMEGKVRPDFRIRLANGTIAAAKSPMSGCVAFHKQDFIDVGGLDRSFRGYGFNDTDFYVKCYFLGFNFINLDLPEFHLYHDYDINKNILLAMNLWNGIKCYNKWCLPICNDILEIAKFLQVDMDYVRTTSFDDFLNLVKLKS